MISVDTSKQIKAFLNIKSEDEKDLEMNGLSLEARDALEVLRIIDKARTHKIRGHAKIMGIGTVSYPDTDYLVIDYNHFYLRGNELTFKDNQVKIFVSSSDWYDIHISNDYGYVTMCFFPNTDK